jgi:hypothetical protein
MPTVDEEIKNFAIKHEKGLYDHVSTVVLQLFELN